MEAGDGAQRKLPVPMVGGGGGIGGGGNFEKSNYTIRELVNPGSGGSSGQSSARQSEAGNDLHERM